jgi:hypothetical protein
LGGCRRYCLGDAEHHFLVRTTFDGLAYNGRSDKCLPPYDFQLSNHKKNKMDEQEQIPIWFFIGGLLLAYGIIITAVGVYYLFVPAPPELSLQQYHPDLWWGILLIVLGGFYTVHYFPRRKKS